MSKLKPNGLTLKYNLLINFKMSINIKSKLYSKFYISKLNLSERTNLFALFFIKYITEKQELEIILLTYILNQFGSIL